MAIWARVGNFLSSVSTEAFSAVVEAVCTVFEGQPEVRKQVGFSIAMIALSAKMAKADGIVTQNEVEAFQQLFAIPEAETNNVARLYNLAKKDVSGYHAYAKQVKNGPVSGIFLDTVQPVRHEALCKIPGCSQNLLGVDPDAVNLLMHHVAQGAQWQ